MGMGSYNLGSKARIFLHVTDGGIAFSDITDPMVTKLILPNGSLASSFPKSMTEYDLEYSIYFYDYTPSVVGDHIAIITYNVDGTEYTAVENFTVNAANSASTSIPRAEARY